MVIWSSRRYDDVLQILSSSLGDFERYVEDHSMTNYEKSKLKGNETRDSDRQILQISMYGIGDRVLTKDDVRVIRKDDFFPPDRLEHTVLRYIYAKSTSIFRTARQSLEFSLELHSMKTSCLFDMKGRSNTEKKTELCPEVQLLSDTTFMTCRMRCFFLPIDDADTWHNHIVYFHTRTAKADTRDIRAWLTFKFESDIVFCLWSSLDMSKVCPSRLYSGSEAEVTLLLWECVTPRGP